MAVVYCSSLHLIAFRAFALRPEKMKKATMLQKIVRAMLEIVEPTLKLLCAILHMVDTY